MHRGTNEVSLTSLGVVGKPEIAGQDVDALLAAARVAIALFADSGLGCLEEFAEFGGLAECLVEQQGGVQDRVGGVAPKVVHIEYLERSVEAARDLAECLRQQVADASKSAEDPLDGRRRDGPVAGEVVDGTDRFVGDLGPAGHVLALHCESDEGPAAVEPILDVGQPAHGRSSS